MPKIFKIEADWRLHNNSVDTDYGLWIGDILIGRVCFNIYNNLWDVIIVYPTENITGILAYGATSKEIGQRTLEDYYGITEENEHVCDAGKNSL